MLFLRCMCGEVFLGGRGRWFLWGGSPCSPGQGNHGTEQGRGRGVQVSHVLRMTDSCNLSSFRCCVSRLLLHRLLLRLLLQRRLLLLRLQVCTRVCRCAAGEVPCHRLDKHLLALGDQPGDWHRLCGQQHSQPPKPANHRCVCLCRSVYFCGGGHHITCCVANNTVSFHPTRQSVVGV